MEQGHFRSASRERERTESDSTLTEFPRLQDAHTARGEYVRENSLALKMSSLTFSATRGASWV